jgi:hypothetical protein
VDLTKKLDMLALLLWRHADVRDGNVVYVNLFAHDAPAVLPRSGMGESRNETVPVLSRPRRSPRRPGDADRVSAAARDLKTARAGAQALCTCAGKPK